MASGERGVVKGGAEEFLTKPVELRGLEVIVQRLLAQQRMKLVNVAARSREARQPVDPFRGQSAAVRRLAEQAERVTSSRAPILILGETGTERACSRAGCTSTARAARRR